MNQLNSYNFYLLYFTVDDQFLPICVVKSTSNALLILQEYKSKPLSIMNQYNLENLFALPLQENVLLTEMNSIFVKMQLIEDYKKLGYELYNSSYSGTLYTIRVSDIAIFVGSTKKSLEEKLRLINFGIDNDCPGIIYNLLQTVSFSEKLTIHEEVKYNVEFKSELRHMEHCFIHHMFQLGYTIQSLHSKFDSEDYGIVKHWFKSHSNVNVNVNLQVKVQTSVNNSSILTNSFNNTFENMTLSNASMSLNNDTGTTSDDSSSTSALQTNIIKINLKRKEITNVTDVTINEEAQELNEPIVKKPKQTKKRKTELKPKKLSYKHHYEKHKDKVLEKRRAYYDKNYKRINKMNNERRKSAQAKLEDTIRYKKYYIQNRTKITEYRRERYAALENNSYLCQYCNSEMNKTSVSTHYRSNLHSTKFAAWHEKNDNEYSIMTSDEKEEFISAYMKMSPTIKQQFAEKYFN